MIGLVAGFAAQEEQRKRWEARVVVKVRSVRDEEKATWVAQLGGQPRAQGWVYAVAAAG